MRISFNIPTYNRAKYLKENLDILTIQIKDLHKEDEVEINISDNASTDDTEKISKDCIAANPQLHISYHRNEKNLGPDGNFITAMNLAHGEYSLLWGDDDFLKEGGLARIFELAEYGDKNDIQILLSSTTVYDKNGKFLSEKYFLRDDIEELTVDFSDLTQARAYFFLLKDMGGMLSFISDVVYKTSIVREIQFDEAFMGTHYAFLCYWWGWLAKGKKLHYSNKSFLKETVQYQAAYGLGVKRTMVDFYGFTIIANVLLNGRSFKRDFLCVLLKLHDDIKLRKLMVSEPTAFKNQIIPKLIECGKSQEEVTFILDSCRIKRIVKEMIFSILPEKVVCRLKNYKVKMSLTN